MNELSLANRILQNETYNASVRQIKKLEKERKYCKHNMRHFLDVARIMTILANERQLDFTRDELYSLALLHDCGRWMQYEQDIPHEIAGANLAKQILMECNADKAMSQRILKAIREHRVKNPDDSLSALLYDADKLSRPCFACKVEVKCNWSDEKKNIQIVI